MSRPAKFLVERDGERWFVVDVEHAKPYRYPVPYPSLEQAEAFMDRLNAIDEGEPPSVIAELRGDADRLRTGQR